MAASDALRKIRRWCELEGYAVQDTPGAPNAQLTVTDLNKRTYTVGRGDGPDGRVLLATAADIPLDVQQRFAGIPESRRREFFWEMNRTLLTMGMTHFQGVGMPFQRVLLFVPVYEHELNWGTFMQRLGLLQRSLSIVIFSITHEFELQAPWE